MIVNRKVKDEMTLRLDGADDQWFLFLIINLPYSLYFPFFVLFLFTAFILCLLIIYKFPFSFFPLILLFFIIFSFICLEQYAKYVDLYLAIRKWDIVSKSVIHFARQTTHFTGPPRPEIMQHLKKLWLIHWGGNHDECIFVKILHKIHVRKSDRAHYTIRVYDFIMELPIKTFVSQLKRIYLMKFPPSASWPFFF